ncbi:MAG: lactoylglutathione lyase [Hyphomonas sp.]
MRQPTQTKGFVFNQTMLRIKEPARSLAFYREVLGMALLKQIDFVEMKFSLFFLGYVDEGDNRVPNHPVDRARYTFSQAALLELTHNWGTENEDGEPYHNGNADPRGFGHIGLSVPNVDDACRHFDDFNVEFVKRPNDGSMKGLAFIQDPDGYWIEILEAASLARLCAASGAI